jgi:hypothetical protein
MKKSYFAIGAGTALCAVGAYGFANELNDWGWWLIIGAIIIGTVISD